MHMSMSSCSACCLGELPVVRDARLPVGGRSWVFASAMDPLFEALSEYTPEERAVLRSRFMPLIDSAEREAQRAENWDARLFAVGFGGSLIVTIAAAINQSAYINSTWRTVIGIAVVFMSSFGTAAVGLRERLKFKEKADVARRSSTNLQRHGFLFVARAGPYASRDRSSAYRTFVRDIERLKANADEQRQSLRDPDNVSAGVAVGGPGGGPDLAYATLGLPDSSSPGNSLSMFGLPAGNYGTSGGGVMGSYGLAGVGAGVGVGGGGGGGIGHVPVGSGAVSAAGAAPGSLSTASTRLLQPQHLVPGQLSFPDGIGGLGSAAAAPIPGAMGPGVMLAPTPQPQPHLMSFTVPAVGGAAAAAAAPPPQPVTQPMELHEQAPEDAPPTI